MNRYFRALNPIVNFIYFAAVILMGMVFIHPLFSSIFFVTAFIYVLWLKRLKGLKVLALIIPVLILITFINPLFNSNGDTLLFNIGSFAYTKEALIYGFTTALAFGGMLMWFICFNTIVSSDKLSTIFAPLIPAISTTLILVFRMIPLYSKKIVLIDEARQGIGRGVNSKAGNLGHRIKMGTSLINSLLSWSLDNSVCISSSMEARGYGSRKRSSYIGKRLDIKDIVLLCIIIAFTITICVYAFLGYTHVDYYPNISFAAHGLDVIICGIVYYIMLSIPFVIDLGEEIRWLIIKSRI